MEQVFFDAPEFSSWYTDSTLKENFDISFKENGWYVLENNDTLLVIERLGRYKVWAWVKTDPRDELEKVLDLPEIK